MNASQVFQYQVVASGLDVDQIIRQLANYGINNVTVERGPNVNGLSITLANPTPQQLQAVQEVLMPLERNFQSAFYRALRPAFGSQLVEGPVASRVGPTSPGSRIQELPVSLNQATLMSANPRNLTVNQGLQQLNQGNQGLIEQVPIIRNQEFSQQLNQGFAQPTQGLLQQLNQGFAQPTQGFAQPTQGFAQQLNQGFAQPTQGLLQQLNQGFAQPTQGFAQQVPQVPIVQNQGFSQVNKGFAQVPQVSLINQGLPQVPQSVSLDQATLIGGSVPSRALGQIAPPSNVQFQLPSFGF